jgi:hypothetical protein
MSSMIIQNKIEDFPIIYLRYLNKKLMYVGESASFLKGRHARDDLNVGEYDTVKILKAPKNKIRRNYWEAYLVIKLKPEMQLSHFCNRKYLAKLNRKNAKHDRKIKININNDKLMFKYAAYDHLQKFKYFIAKSRQ